MADPQIRLVFDTHPVGVRRIRDAAPLYLSVRLASALAEQPTAPSAAHLKMLFPWNLLAGVTDFLVVDVRHASRAFRVIASSVTADAFHAIVQSDFETRMIALLPDRLFLGWSRGAGDGDLVDEVYDADSDVMRPWLGIAGGLAALPPEISLPLLARAMVAIDGQVKSDLLNLLEEYNWDRPLVLAPASITVEGTKFDRLTWSFDEQDQLARLSYAEASGSKDPVIAFARPLPGAMLDRPFEMPGIVGYWAEVSDSRETSLAEAEMLVAGKADMPALLAPAPRADLAASLSVKMPGQVFAPLTGAQFDALLGAVELAMYPDDEEAWRRTFTDRVLAGIAAGSNEALAHSLTDQIIGWWVEAIARINAILVLPGPDPDPKIERLRLELRKRLNPDAVYRVEPQALRPAVQSEADALARRDPTPDRALPGEGLDFCVGPQDRRLQVEKRGEASQRNAENELAELGLLVSRRIDAGNPGAWRAVSAGVPVHDPSGLLATEPWGNAATANLKRLQRLVPRGIPLAYRDSVLRNDDTYRGQLLIGPNAMSHVHDHEASRQEGDPDEAIEDESALAFVSAGPIRDVVPHAASALAPVLRYQDQYDLCVYAIDRGGGLPKEIMEPGAPWRLNFAALATAQVPSGRICRFQFQRRIPLGDLNLQPASSPAGKNRAGFAQWPPVPKGVKLRCQEWLESKVDSDSGLPKAEQVPTALLWEERESISFTLEPPQIDEHTLQRWALPAADADPVSADTAIKALKKELGEIASRRSQLAPNQPPPLAGDETLLPHDPAAWGVAWVIEIFDALGNRTSEVSDWRRFEESVPFHKKRLTLRCSRTASPAVADLIDLPPVPPGSFAIARFHLLLSTGDVARFDYDVLKYRDAPIHQPSGAHLIAGPVIAIETATSELPSSAALYDGTRLRANDLGQVVFGFDAAAFGDADRKAFAFIDSFELARQRWVWRNLPNVAPPGSNDDEPRLSSGLPLALADPSQSVRDNDPSLLVFDARAAVDNCFVNRDAARGRWPRDKDNRPATETVLLVDDRDAQSAADYLRYDLKVISRYQPLYPVVSRRRAEPTGDVPGHPALNAVRGNWRRIACGYRGNPELRPLNILALLPLTAQPLIDPETGNASVPDPDAGTPFLIILDEIWFREYGPGEAMRAELALEDREIGDVDDEGVATRRPLRYGPLPHKHTKPRAPGTDEFLDEEIEGDAGVRCSCFGPFGFSLDRSGNEALANATAFVVYLPKKYAEIGPHWSTAVRFRRVLHDLTSGAPTAAKSGPASSPHLLYTIADSGGLARIRDGGRAVVAPDFTLQGTGVQFDLSPYRRDGNLPDQAILDRHLYVMLLGRSAQDGGRGVEVFLPDAIVRIHRDKLAKLDGQPLTVLPGGDRAQLLEIELDGAAGGDLAKDMDLRSFFKALLPVAAEPADTPGRILRISSVFPIAIAS